jgi:hypothetical protein
MFVCVRTKTLVHFIVSVYFIMGKNATTRTINTEIGVPKTRRVANTQVLNETLFPILSSKQSSENPFYNYRDVFDTYNITSIYNYFEPDTVPGPFYNYLKDIFTYINYFTDGETLNAFNVSLQTIVDFLKHKTTQEDIDNILHNSQELNKLIGAKSNVFAIALQLQEIQTLYKGLMSSDGTRAGDARTAILANVDDTRFAEMNMIARLQRIRELMDNNILSADTVNLSAVDKLCVNVESKMSPIVPLQSDIKRELRKLKKRGVSDKRINELIDYMTMYGRKSAKRLV